MNYTDVLNFWFKEINSDLWFKKDPEFDEEIRLRFGLLHEAITKGECASWRSTIKGRLAEVIVLDQFSRNLYRDDPRSFAYDGMALVLTQEALNSEEYTVLTPQEKAFLYMPLMHSESLIIHEEALKRFAEPQLETNLKYEKKHFAILTRFGRYPHRNKTLNRTSTSEELEFLKLPNSSF